MRAYCVRCGIDERVKSDLEVEKQYSDMDVYLKFSRKKGVAALANELIGKRVPMLYGFIKIYST